MKSSIFFAAMLCCIIASAQQSPIIQFDRTGMIRSSLPERLGKGDNLIFKVSDPLESFDNYLKTYKNRLKQASSILVKLKNDQEKMDILKKVFDISSTDLDGVIAQLDQHFATPVGSGGTTHVPGFKASDKNYFNFAVTHTANPDADDVEPNTNTKKIPVKPFASDPQIKFTVTQKDPFRKLAMSWLKGSNTDYGGAIDFGQIQQLQNKINELLKEVASFAAKARPEMTNLKADLAKKGDEKALFNKYRAMLSEIVSKSDNYINQIDDIIKKLDAAINLHDKKSWMLKWLWYQKSPMPALNPLGFVEAVGAAPDTSMLESLRAKIQVREAFLKVNSDKLKTTQVDSMLDVIDALKKNIFQAQKAVKQFDERKASNEKALLAFRTTAKELNNGLLFVEDNEATLYWMRHHNAAVNFQLMNTLETDEFLETDRVVILAHNLKVNEMAKLTLTLTEITNDASLLTEELTPIIASLQGALLGTGAAATTAFDNLAKKADDNLNKLIARLEKLEDKLKENTPYLAYLLQQTNPPLELEEETDKSLAYHSEITNPVKKIKGPRKATYYLKTELVDKNSPDSAKINKLPADTFSYRINKLYRIFPMAGVTWSPNRFSSVNVDSTGKYSVDHESKVRFIVGVKVYLRKTDIRSSKFITEKDHAGKRVFLSRTSLNLAFDARKPLDNIYTGAGLDLWPGFCLNFGALFNKYTYKSYKNGAAYEVKKPYRAGFYMGLSTDLTLFTELGKFLNF